MPRFTSVKLDDLDKIRRMPRLGKIRLGLKVQKAGGKEYPKECDYFVLPHEVLKKLGIDKPEEVKELDIMFGSEDLAEVFPVRLAAYKSSGLFCEGDGTQAVRRQKGQWVDQKCPCIMLDNGDCKKVGTLNVILPAYSLGGCFQIVTSSWNSIVDINSGIDHVRKLVGRISWVPLKLVREPTPTAHYDKAKDKTFKQTHWTLKVLFPYDLDFVNRLKLETEAIMSGPQYRLPAPQDNPYDDPVDLIEEDKGKLTPAPAPDKDEPEKVDAERMPPSAPREDAKPADAKTAPATPAAAPVAAPSDPNATMTEEHATKLWKAANLAFRKDMTRAKGFFKFFVEKYVGVAKSTDVPYDLFAIHLPALLAISKVTDDTKWKQELSTYVNTLKKDAKARIEAARKAGGNA